MSGDMFSFFFNSDKRLNIHNIKNRRHNFDSLPTLFCEICNTKFLGRKQLNANMTIRTTVSSRATYAAILPTKWRA